MPVIRHLLRTALAVACLAEAELLGRRARLVRRVDELERRLAAALASIEREAAGVDVDACPCVDVPSRHLDDDGHLPRCPRSTGVDS
jgi:hypothetical protein